MIPQTKVLREIPVEWDRLMRLAATIGRGRIERIVINDGLPVDVEVSVKKINLIKDDDFNQKLRTIPIV